MRATRDELERAVLGFLAAFRAGPEDMEEAAEVAEKMLRGGAVGTHGPGADANGDCAACFDAVVDDARGKLSPEWGWTSERGPQLGGPPCHWARRTADEASRTRGLRNWKYEAACGKKFEAQIDSGD